MGEGFTMKYHPKRLLCLLMILCLAALAAQGYAPFVYFQF